ncbi:hypothetical protein Srot_1185 [Segniliparus rotundus DSM 44985]|uniref:Uncharacterized protein n=1 Tax=Segniliparus rotundus (strain ATCC BAA-972 / CDC 1076 / CIP 108378 / DSM 44985 / JCM 13578) TaxID=640132 RepID=D6ZFD2_SEGRD|nr:hypothetical protein [Segniliparus rotundus]ADG97656.1 hypothetical protein Srot_1185 [Segniliparus rotundus DSM 44985]
MSTATAPALPDEPERKPTLRLADPAPARQRTARHLAEHRTDLDLMLHHREKAAEHAELAKRHEAQIKAALGDADVGVLDGRAVVTWESHQRTGLDQAKLKRDWPIAFADCQRTTRVRVFRAVDE